MIIQKCDKKKCGIYCIINTVNNKKYVGKAKNIYNRLKQHIRELNAQSKNENRHLKAAWLKYGENVFIYEILEELELDEEKLKLQEDFWIMKYNCIDRKFGYNLRRDSSTKCIVSDETKRLLSEKNTGENNPNFNHKWSDGQKKKMSEIKKAQYKNKEITINPENGKKGAEIRNKNWENNPTLKENMKKKVSQSITNYCFEQYDKKTGDLIRIWDSVYDILLEHPDWKRHNIYAACSGEKPSIYGYKWKKVLKDDIVQQ